MVWYGKWKGIGKECVREGMWFRSGKVGIVVSYDNDDDDEWGVWIGFGWYFLWGLY